MITRTALPSVLFFSVFAAGCGKSEPHESIDPLGRPNYGVYMEFPKSIQANLEGTAVLPLIHHTKPDGKTLRRIKKNEDGEVLIEEIWTYNGKGSLTGYVELSGTGRSLTSRSIERNENELATTVRESSYNPFQGTHDTIVRRTEYHPQHKFLVTRNEVTKNGSRTRLLIRTLDEATLMAHVEILSEPGATDMRCTNTYHDKDFLFRLETDCTGTPDSNALKYSRKSTYSFNNVLKKYSADEKYDLSDHVEHYIESCDVNNRFIVNCRWTLKNLGSGDLKSEGSTVSQLVRNSTAGGERYDTSLLLKSSTLLHPHGSQPGTKTEISQTYDSFWNTTGMEKKVTRLSDSSFLEHWIKARTSYSGKTALEQQEYFEGSEKGKKFITETEFLR